jgi:glycosyltransferase involved in cell wall biosynthesis
LRNGRKHLVGYVGIMGAQDGVDLLIDAMEHIVRVQGRDDVQCAIVGSGTELPALQKLAEQKGLSDYVTFTGFLSGDALLKAFSSFDIGAIPDPKNVYNDKISMNKVFEYMSLGIPFVQFDLAEGRNMAGDAALYATNNDPAEFASNLLRLADDRVLYEQLRSTGEARAKAHLNWDVERARLLAAYDSVLTGSAMPKSGTGRRGPLDATQAR